jgi:hypothetical protein
VLSSCISPAGGYLPPMRSCHLETRDRMSNSHHCLSVPGTLNVNGSLKDANMKLGPVTRMCLNSDLAQRSADLRIGLDMIRP